MSVTDWQRLLAEARSQVAAANSVPAEFDDAIGFVMAGGEVERPPFRAPAEAGRWRVGAPLGRGGMGEIFAARNLDDQGPGAIKFLDPLQPHPADIERFVREVAALDRLSNPSHPNIIGMLDHGVLVDGTPWIVLEYAEGRDLRQHTLGRPMPADWVASVGRQVCLAIGHAHRAGFVHRDVKLDNVLLVGAGLVKLSDFGLVMFLHRLGEVTLTRTRERVGTLAYMAPEQLDFARRSEIGVCTDIYQAGLMLRELLTGERPQWDREAGVAVLPGVVGGPLAELAERATHDDTARRFASADEMAAALLGFC